MQRQAFLDTVFPDEWGVFHPPPGSSPFALVAWLPGDTEKLRMIATTAVTGVERPGLGPEWTPKHIEGASGGAIRGTQIIPSANAVGRRVRYITDQPELSAAIVTDFVFLEPSDESLADVLELCDAIVRLMTLTAD